MSDSNITRLALADSLKALMKKKRLDKISVSDIVAHCGLTRQAFYYHFKDKYDLVNWIYYTETLPFMSSFDEMEHWTSGLCALCRYMKEHRRFYGSALQIQGPDSLQECIHEYIKNISIAMVEANTGQSFDHEKYDFTVDFFASAFVSLLVRWASKGMKEEPDAYIAQISAIFDGSLFSELYADKT